MSLATLANSELSVMDLLWREGQLTARQIREQLYADDTKAQHGTVQRLLQRLEEKGFVARDKDLPVHLFAPLLSREDYASGQLESLANKLTGGSVAPLITHLIDHKKISGAELDKLKQIINAFDGEESRHD